MKLAALLALTLAGCSSVSGPLDWITPDELTIGQGSSTMDTHTTGGYINHQDMYEYEGEGEGESTYAALTWDLPSWQGRDEGMDRETQRNMALLIDLMVEEEGLTTAAVGVTDGDDPVIPSWLPLLLGGVVVIVLLAGVLFTRKQKTW